MELKKKNTARQSQTCRYGEKIGVTRKEEKWERAKWVKEVNFMVMNGS